MASVITQQMDGVFMTMAAFRYIYLRIKVVPENREAFFEFLRAAIPFYERDGETRMVLIEDANEQNTFIEIVEYQTEGAFLRGEEAVRSDPETLKYLARWRGLLAGPPVVEEYVNCEASIRGAGE